MGISGLSRVSCLRCRANPVCFAHETSRLIHPDSGNSIRDVRDYMLASIRLQHPEWLKSAGNESRFDGCHRKLAQLLAVLDAEDDFSQGLAA